MTRHGDVLGVFEGLHFEATTVALGSGDALLLYTDGVTDAWHPGNGDYSIDRLTAALVAGPENAGELLAHLEADLDAFTEGAPQQDGVMILILTRN